MIDPLGLAGMAGTDCKKKCMDHFLRTSYGPISNFVTDTAVPEFSLISFFTNFDEFVKTSAVTTGVKVLSIYGPKALAWVNNTTSTNLMNYPGMAGAAADAAETGAWWGTTAATAEWVIAPAVVGIVAFSTTADIYARIECWGVQ